MCSATCYTIHDFGYSKFTDIFITLGSEMPTPELVIDSSPDKVIIIGWLHFLAFDVLAGRYIWNRMVS